MFTVQAPDGIIWYPSTGKSYLGVFSGIVSLNLMIPTDGQGTNLDLVTSLQLNTAHLPEKFVTSSVI